MGRSKAAPSVGAGSSNGGGALSSTPPFRMMCRTSENRAERVGPRSRAPSVPIGGSGSAQRLLRDKKRGSKRCVQIPAGGRSVGVQAGREEADAHVAGHYVSRDDLRAMRARRRRSSGTRQGGAPARGGTRHRGGGGRP